MDEVASRELRNNTRRLLDRIDGGETLTITVDGRAVAVLSPVEDRPMWMGRAEFARRVVGHQADPALLDELRDLTPGTTDDLPL